MRIQNYDFGYMFVVAKTDVLFFDHMSVFSLEFVACGQGLRLNGAECSVSDAASIYYYAIQ